MNNEPTQIECPHCGKDCFEEDYKDITSWLCFRCGYTSNSTLEVGSKVVEEAENSTAQIVKDLKFEDKERKINWYPAVINIPLNGVIFPEGTVDDWKWAYAPIIEISEEDQKKYPVPGKDNEYYQTRLAVENSEYYPKEDFLGAAKRLGIIQDMIEQLEGDK